MKKAERIDPSLFFETMNAYQRTEALKAALDFDLFTALSEGPLGAEELASKISASVKGTRILSDYLCIIGFLEKANECYQLTPSSGVFLVRSSPAYVGGTRQFLASPTIVSGFSNLASAVKKGGTTLPDSGTVSPENPVWVDFAEGMGAMMQLAAKSLAEGCERSCSEPLRVLDIAAGHGEFGFAFASRFPKSTVFALDWAPVLDHTKKRASMRGITGQLQYLAGDAFEIALPNNLDIILIPNFLHHFSENDCIRFLSRLPETLAKNGEVLILEFIPNSDRISPPGSAAFALTMLASTEEGDAYTFEEYKRMLNTAGFTSVDFHKPEAGMEGLIRGRL